MILRPLGIFLLLAGIAGCASEPVAVNYYALVPPAAATDEVVQRGDQPALVIERVELPEYLQRPGMVIQTGSNRLSVSKNNLWAENLVLALPKALVRELQRQSEDYSYYVKTLDWVDRTDFRLRLRIDSLQATTRGEVITAGRFQLISEHEPSQQMIVDFNFQRDLDQDGFEHSVEQIQWLVSEIAGAIIKAADEMHGQ